MKIRIALFFSLTAVSAITSAGEKTENREALTKLTFYVAGVECPACVYAVNDSVRRVEGVSDVAEGQAGESYANVTFDSRQASAHQIAQAVSDAFPLHGVPYAASLKIRIPDYAKDNNAERIKAVFSRWKGEIQAEVKSPAQGLVIARFLPLPATTGTGMSRGWNHEQLIEALRAPAPEGLGLEVIFVTEN